MGGLFRESLTFRPECDELQISTVVVQSGDLREVWPHVKTNFKMSSSVMVSGAGTGINEEECLVRALVEGLERYCAGSGTEEQVIFASANELGNRALDLEAIPICSRTELSHPRCPLVLPDKKNPIRWIQGISLLDGGVVYLPAVMVFLYAGFVNRAERICVPISTGCAGHTSYERALLNGILEVVERDAISLVWLQKMPLSKIKIDIVPEALAFFWDRYQRSSKNLGITFFDATTDLGIPTVYGLQVAPGANLTTMVACSSTFDPCVALSKVIRDMAACNVGFRSQRPAPQNPEDCEEVFQGARYMASPERFGAFNFLTNSQGCKRLSEMPAMKESDDRSELRLILELFRRKGVNVYAVDLTTDEAMRCGIRVVRVIIPELLPLGFHYRARYLGTSRLYDAPVRMGYPAYEETQLNQWPQPFA